MRCAYLILAHRYPDQLARLIASLILPQAAQSAGDKAFIHIDKRIDPALYQDALQRQGLSEGADYEFILDRVVTAWGDFSLVQATLNLIRSCTASASGYDNLSLLSGQDYPLTSAFERKRRLADVPQSEHLSWFTLPREGWALGGGLDRIRKYHNPGLRERIRTSGLPGGRYLGAGIAFALSLVPRSRAVPGDLTVYGGWQWWTLTSACAQYTLNYIDENPNLVRYFRYSMIPDELFFQTIILNSPFQRRVTGDYLRYVQWNGIKPHEFEPGDLPALVSAGETCLFARKFDAQQAGTRVLLDELDALADERRSGADTMQIEKVGRQLS